MNVRELTEQASEVRELFLRFRRGCLTDRANCEFHNGIHKQKTPTAARSYKAVQSMALGVVIRNQKTPLSTSTTRLGSATNHFKT